MRAVTEIWRRISGVDTANVAGVESSETIRNRDTTGIPFGAASELGAGWLAGGAGHPHRAVPRKRA